MLGRRNRSGEQAVWLGLLDAVCLLTAIVSGILLRRQFGSVFGLPPLEDTLGEYVTGHLDGWIYFCGGIVLANYIVGSYSVRGSVSRFDLAVNWAFSLAVALLLLTVTSYAWFDMLLGRGVLATAVASYGILSLAAKGVFYGAVIRSDLFLCRTVILGTGEHAREVRKTIENSRIVPRHEVSAYLSVAGPGSAPGAIPASIDGVEVVFVAAGGLEEAVWRLGPDLLVVCFDRPADAFPHYRAIRHLLFRGVEVHDLLSAAEVYGGKVPLDLVDDAWLMEASLRPSIAVVRRFKRVLDLVCATVASVLLVPLSLLVGMLIKLSSPRSPVFYSQERVGQFGRPFRIFKFRTMIVNAESGVGAVWSSPGDPRVTVIGRVLRRFRIDEIPQFLNILRGEMSLVGPRPERPELASRLEKIIPHFRERETVPPGLTGWAQIQYPYGDSADDAARKLEFDLYYIRNLSVRLDLQIVLRTVRIVILGKEKKA